MATAPLRRPSWLRLIEVEPTVVIVTTLLRLPIKPALRGRRPTFGLQRIETPLRTRRARERAFRNLPTANHYSSGHGASGKPEKILSTTRSTSHLEIGLLINTQPGPLPKSYTGTCQSLAANAIAPKMGGWGHEVKGRCSAANLKQQSLSNVAQLRSTD